MGNELNCLACNQKSNGSKNVTGIRLESGGSQRSIGHLAKQKVHKNRSHDAVINKQVKMDCSTTGDDMRSQISFKFSPDKIHPNKDDSQRQIETTQESKFNENRKDYFFNINKQSQEDKCQFDFSEHRMLVKVKSISDYYKVGRVIGQGTYGKVREANHIESGLYCAIKIVRKAQIQVRKSLVNYMESELLVLEEVSHLQMLRVYELLHDDQHIFIVTEIVTGGDLLKLLLNHNRLNQGLLPEVQVSQIAKQLFQALDALHEQNIIHRDIKLENILIKSHHDGETVIKIADFGFAAKYPFVGDLGRGAGTRYYVAPEMMKKKKYDYKIDVWSSTVLVFVLLCGKLPYNGQSFKEVEQKIESTNPIDFLEKSKISPEAISFIKAGLVKDKNKRATVKQMLDHEWIRNTPLPHIENRVTISNLKQGLFRLRAGEHIDLKSLSEISEHVLSEGDFFDVGEFDSYPVAERYEIIIQKLRALSPAEFSNLMSSLY